MAAMRLCPCEFLNSFVETPRAKASRLSRDRCTIAPPRSATEPLSGSRPSGNDQLAGRSRTWETCDADGALARRRCLSGPLRGVGGAPC
jgi:hypothetical protein